MIVYKFLLVYGGILLSFFAFCLLLILIYGTLKHGLSYALRDILRNVPVITSFLLVVPLLVAIYLAAWVCSLITDSIPIQLLVSLGIGALLLKPCIKITAPLADRIDKWVAGTPDEQPPVSLTPKEEWPPMATGTYQYGEWPFDEADTYTTAHPTFQDLARDFAESKERDEFPF